MLLWASRWFQIESLYRFNAKFRPEWEPRYICYPAARDMPRIAIAALEAEAFIAMPQLPAPFRRRVRDGATTTASTAAG
jgi:lysyl-tRNA synthetase class 2